MKSDALLLLEGQGVSENITQKPFGILPKDWLVDEKQKWALNDIIVKNSVPSVLCQTIQSQCVHVADEEQQNVDHSNRVEFEEIWQLPSQFN